MTTRFNAENVPSNVPTGGGKRSHRKDNGTPRGVSVYRREMKGGHLSETYYCRFRFRDKSGLVKQAQLDTGTTDYRAAVRWAVAQKAARSSDQKNLVLAGSLSQDRPGLATVGKILDAWQDGQTSAGDATAARTVQTFRMVWSQALGVDCPALEKMPVSSLTKAALMAWIAGRQGLPRPDFRRPLPENNGIRARLREVRSILSPKRAHLWAEAGLAVCDFGPILSVPMPEATEIPFRWIEDETMAAIEGAVNAADHDPNLQRAFWMMRLLAMRNSEVSACRVGWAERMDGRLFLRLCHRPEEKFALKRRENVRFLEIPGQIAGYFDGPADAYILTGSPTERTATVFRRLNLLVRKYLPDREKGAYELRKQRISEEMVATGSIAAAAALAGDLVATIERHYCDISANLPALKMRRAAVLKGGVA